MQGFPIPINGDQGPLIGHSRRWEGYQSPAGMRWLHVSGLGASLKGNFAVHASAGSYPKRSKTLLEADVLCKMRDVRVLSAHLLD